MGNVQAAPGRTLRPSLALLLLLIHAFAAQRSYVCTEKPVTCGSRLERLML